MSEEIGKRWLVTFETANVSQVTGDVNRFAGAFQRLAADIRAANVELDAYFARVGGGGAGVPFAQAPITTAAPVLQAAAPAAMTGAVPAAGPAVVTSPEQLRQLQQTARVARREVRATAQATSLWARESRRMVGYTMRYLVRYLLVWQGLRAVRRLMSDWIQSHDDLAMSMLRLQWAMGITGPRAERYMGRLMGISGAVGVPAAQLAGAAIAGGPQFAQQVGQLAQITGAEFPQMQAFLTQVRRDFRLTDQEFRMFIARFHEAFVKSGEPIDQFIRHWQEMIGEIAEGPDVLARYEERLVQLAESGVQATNRLSAAWANYTGILGDTAAITAAKSALAELFVAGREGIQELERQGTWARLVSWMPLIHMPFGVGLRMAGQGQAEPGATVAGRTITSAHERWRLTGERPGALGPGQQYGLQRFLGTMTQRQYGQMSRLAKEFDKSMEQLGVKMEDVVARDLRVQTEHGYRLDRIVASAEGIQWATEEMRDILGGALVGYFNWPAGAAGQPTAMIVGRGIAQVRRGPETVSEESFQRSVGQGSWQPTTFPPYSEWPTRPADWPLWNIPGTQREPNLSTAGAPVYAPPPAMSPRSQPSYTWSQQHEDRRLQEIQGSRGGAGGDLKQKIELHVSGDKMAETTNKILGDKLRQATRAAGGQVGGLVSPP